MALLQRKRRRIRPNVIKRVQIPAVVLVLLCGVYATKRRSVEALDGAETQLRYASTSEMQTSSEQSNEASSRLSKSANAEPSVESLFLNSPLDGAEPKQPHASTSKTQSSRPRWNPGPPSRVPASTNTEPSSVASTKNAKHRDLKDVLFAGAGDGGACTKQTEIRGYFVSRDVATIKEVERRIHDRVGFGWARWGDAEMLASAKEGSPMRAAVTALMSRNATPNCVLNVGVHWLCNAPLKNAWNAAMANVDVDDTVGHACFFLPMGDPGDDDRPMWKKKGTYFPFNTFRLPARPDYHDCFSYTLRPTDTFLLIVSGIDGYVDAIRKAKRKVILLGPPHVQNLPFIGQDAFVDASGAGGGGDGVADGVIKTLFEIGDAFDDPPVVIMTAGMAAKSAILLGQDRINFRGWGFIDAGTTLDGYAGVKSRDYNDPRKYCQKSRERTRGDGDGVEFWFAPGVCEKFPQLPRAGGQRRTHHRNGV
jgi:hypothetical protein